MDGQAKATPAGYELRFERHFSHPVAEVWAALTQPEGLIAWLAEAELEPVQGGRVRLQWLNSRDEHGNYHVATGMVTAIDPPRLIEYDTDIHGRLRWELQPEAGGCLLTLTVLYVCPVGAVAEMLAGWHIHLDHLAAALAGERVDWPRWMDDYWSRWATYRDRYAAAIGK